MAKHSRQPCGGVPLRQSVKLAPPTDESLTVQARERNGVSKHYSGGTSFPGGRCFRGIRVSQTYFAILIPSECAKSVFFLTQPL